MQLSSKSSSHTFNWQILVSLKSDTMKHLSTIYIVQTREKFWKCRIFWRFTFRFNLVLKW